MSQSSNFLGIIKKGQFHVLDPPQAVGKSLRFTSMSMQESRRPESAELDLKEFEGSAVLIRGHGDSGWVYSAEMIDQATPIVTELVRRVFATSHSDEKGSDQIVRGYFGLGTHENVVRINSSHDYRLHIWARNVETSQGGIQIMTPQSQFRGSGSSGANDALVLDVPAQTGKDLGSVGAQGGETITISNAFGARGSVFLTVITAKGATVSMTPA
ncbi:hypothetical protein DYD21_17970 [Rhodohalobacter sp. SW132]|uniref:hypothetical protein n=1 Tax=Rhodohalobacter sp. SW132 TaxID=2293433 RepID=UPI000E232B0E|nr:hypothetical protein [Rhodohalobacter sp. SW132]REL24483.1 hypothetical protein DYD21_17970 [Rhodohalobacter sp. SW132]